MRLGGAGYPPITGSPGDGRRARSSYLAVGAAGRPRVPGGATLNKAKLDLRPLRAATRGGPAQARRARPPADQRRGSPPGSRQRGRARPPGGLVAGGRSRHRAPAAVCGACSRAAWPRGSAPGDFLDWASVEPFAGDVAAVRLRVLHPKLAKLHPAQIADLVEAASHREGEEIIQAVGQDDRELEADVFEELDRAAPAGVHRAALRRCRSPR